MPALSSTRDQRDQRDQRNQPNSDLTLPAGLPQLPTGHGLKIGDRIEMPRYAETVNGDGYRGDKIKGTVKHIDLKVRGIHYTGLVMLGDDSRYYVLYPHLIRKI